MNAKLEISNDGGTTWEDCPDEDSCKIEEVEDDTDVSEDVADILASVTLHVGDVLRVTAVEDE